MLATGGTATQLLLIGPEVDMLELLDELLTDEGFVVQTATDMSTIEQRLSDPTFDVVICDEVAGELDGLLVFDALGESASDPAPSFILLGDSADAERISLCLERSMDEYITKPFDVLEMIARIQKVVRTRHAVLAAAAAPADEAAGEDDDGRIVGIAGNLDYMNLPDILMNLHQNGQTGRLIIYVEDGEYKFGFSTGELVDVRGPRGLKARKAFYRAMRDARGRFEFEVLETVNGRRTSAFENLANAILQAVQEADEFPLTRRSLPPDPVAVSLTAKVEETPLPDNSAIQPLLEGLIKSTTVDILIHACPKTDLEAAKELEELMMAEVLVQSDNPAAERAS